LLLGLLAYLCGMELADFAGPRRRWVDHLVEEDDLAGLTGDGNLAVLPVPQTQRSGRAARGRRRPPRPGRLEHGAARPARVPDIFGNCLRLCLWLVATGSTDIATLQNLQVYLQHNMPPAYLAPCWVWQWLWLPVFV